MGTVEGVISRHMQISWRKEWQRRKQGGAEEEMIVLVMRIGTNFGVMCTHSDYPRNIIANYFLFYTRFVVMAFLRNIFKKMYILRFVLLLHKDHSC